MPLKPALHARKGAGQHFATYIGKGNDMRKLGIAIALASTAMASPSLAKDISWYIGADIGAMIVEDADTTYATGVTANTPHKVGYDAAGYVGYDFGGFRLEAEYSHKKADNKNTTYSAGPILSGGMARVDSVMLNGLIDFNQQPPVFNFLADVKRANLKNLNLLDQDVAFTGKFNVNFTGSNIDNFLGDARITDATLTRDGVPLPFDSLIVSSYVKMIRKPCRRIPMNSMRG